MDIKKKDFSCSECGTQNCYRQNSKYPDFCLTTSLSDDELLEVREIYKNKEVARMMQAAAAIEGKYYGQFTRVEETIEFAKSIGANKIGIATCIGLLEEARIFSGILSIKGLIPYCVVCKVGSIDKCELGIADEVKLRPREFEASCNPVLQAEILNREKTGLNVVIGLCVGHDAIFNKYSKAPVTTLITKDRVLAHNPVATLYTAKSYYKRLLKD